MRKVVLVLLFLDVFLLATFKLGDYDIWYHLAAGKHILNTGSLIQTDPFSYTAAARPWSLQSWLAGVLFYAVFAAVGINGLILLNAALVTAAFILVYRTMRLYADGPHGFGLAVALVLVAAFTARFRFMVRPHIIEFLCLAAVLYLLSLHRIRGRNLLFLLPLIQILWVNSHASHILGIVLPLLFLLGGELQRFVPGAGAGSRALARPRARVQLAAALGATIVATLLNPVTYQAFALPFLITGQEKYMQNIGEWQPLRWQHLWGYGIRYTWGFVVLAVLSLAGLLRRLKSPDLTGLALTGLFLLAAVKGIRLTAEFGIVVAPIVFGNLAGAGPAWGERGGRALRIALAVLLAAVVPPLIVTSPTYAFGLGVKEGKFPERALAFVEANGIRGRMFNSFGFGDYFCWRAFPQRQVFIHGRNEVFPESFYEEYLAAIGSADGWRALTEKHGVTYAILHYAVADYGGGRRVAHLLENAAWVPVYWDMTAVIYLKDVAENRALLAREGYRWIKPANFSFQYIFETLPRSGPQPFLHELDRLIRQSPTNEEAYLARAAIRFFISPDFADRAIEDVLAAIKINPKRALSHAALGKLYESKGRRREAAAAFQTAARLDPHNATALAGLQGIHDKTR